MIQWALAGRDVGWVRHPGKGREPGPMQARANLDVMKLLGIDTTLTQGE